MKPRRVAVLDPELIEMSQIAHRETLEGDKSLEAIFENVAPILNRKPARAVSIGCPDIPEALRAKVIAMADPEDRIRAIVQFKLSGRAQRNNQL